ncbi:PP2C family protein-serine/threonine phosphatase [Micromonospora echinospora]
MTITTGLASRQGTRAHNADAVHIYQGDDGTTVAAVIDGTGNDAELAHITATMATVVARVSYRRGGLAALLTASDLLHDDYNAAAVTVQVDPDGHVHAHWIGDSRAYWWDGTDLRQLTTDHTMGQLLRLSGGKAAEQVAATHDHWLRLGLAEATPASVAEIRSLTAEDTPLAAGHLVILTSDGVHDAIPHATLVALIRDHADPQTLADAIAAAARVNAEGYRDDATVAVVAMG